MTQPPGWPPEGWYPNPDNHEQQRWWDGHQWTEHVAVGAPMAPGAVPPAAGQPAPVAYQPQPTPQPAPYGYGGYAGYGGPAGPAAYGGGYSAYPQVAVKGLLPDGARVAGWWLRVLARVIDGILLWIPAVIIGIPQLRDIWNIFRDYFDQVRAAADAGQQAPTLNLMSNGTYLRAATTLTLIYALVWIAYELVMLKLCAATLGKLACGLRVRSWHERGPLSFAMVGKRVMAFQVANAVPTVGPFYVLVDELWPLWDQNKQALHDKLAGTAVVRKADAQAAPGR